jgi:hypothetical protein
VSGRPREEISEKERCYENGEDPKLLDIIQIPLLQPRPKHFQSENHLIDDRYYWQRMGRVGWENLEAALDSVDGPLWLNGNSSYNGVNDRVTEQAAEGLPNSLLLIRPRDLKVVVVTEGAAFGNPRRRLRAQFRFNDDSYLLSVTDPHVEREYLKRENGTYALGEAILCVSLGEPYEGHAYKLVAGLITSERA